MQQVFTTRPEIRGTFGAVASTHWIASATAMSVLERGGNAFDAAAAAGFVLQIVEPHLVGPGGEVPIILKQHDSSEPIVICGQGPYPSGATLEYFAALGLTQVPGTGMLPSVVPGAFDGWMVLLRDYGTWPLDQIIEPAIRYAQLGFPVMLSVATAVREMKDFFVKEWPTSAAVWTPNQTAPEPRQLFCTPAIAETYRRIVAEACSAGSNREMQIERARDVFYRGFVAEAIDRFYRSNQVMDSSGRRHGGPLRGEDMARYRATKESTVSRRYRGVRIHKTGPWGQGPVLLQAAAMIEGFDLDRMGPVSPEFVHTMVECMKLAYADREVFYGDPNFVDVPLEQLLSDDYAASRRRLVSDQASPTMRPGELPGAAERMKRVLAMAGAETPSVPGVGEMTFPLLSTEGGDTVHVSVVDRLGNMIAATPSGGWLESSPVVPGLGFPITTRGQMGWLEPGHPSTVRPQARPRTTLTPTLVTRDGEAYIAMGTPGGDQQEQWTLAVLLRYLHHELDLQAAIDMPLFASLHFPQSFYPRTFQPNRLLMEDQFLAPTIAELKRKGHDIDVVASWSLGRVCAVGRDAGSVIAAATPRSMQAYAIGR